MSDQDELGALGSAFNQLSSRFYEMKRELKEAETARDTYRDGYKSLGETKDEEIARLRAELDGANYRIASLRGMHADVTSLHAGCQKACAQLRADLADRDHQLQQAANLMQVATDKIKEQSELLARLQINDKDATISFLEDQIKDQSETIRQLRLTGAAHASVADLTRQLREASSALADCHERLSRISAISSSNSSESLSEPYETEDH